MVQLNHPVSSMATPTNPPLSKNLRLKLILIMVWAILFPVIIGVAVLINEITQLPSTTLWLLLILSIAPMAVWAFIIWHILRPLNDLYEGVKVVMEGHTDHRFNIHTGDELETIAQLLNSVAVNLSQATSQSTQAKTDIVAERNKLNTIIASITDGVIVLDLHRNIVLVNIAAEKISGLTQQEILGQTADDFISFKTKDGKIETVADVLKVGQGQPTPKPIPLTLIGKRNTEKAVEVIVAPIAEGIQANLGCVLIIYDISQRQDLEQMQIDFVSMASHEIRTPLTSVVNYLQTVSDESAGKLDPELKGFLDRALLSAKQLSVLVTNLLDVSKVERGSMAIFLQPVNWEGKIQQIVSDNKAAAVQKGLLLTYHPPVSPLPQVMADETRINEVANNLISNAINHSKPGCSIDVSCRVEGKEVITAVADNGEGIPKEAIPHLFTKFFRVAGSLEQMKQGTGLGLYISKSIIDLHHGRIWVESEFGKGSTFYFSLPVATNSGPTMADLLKKPAV